MFTRAGAALVLVLLAIGVALAVGIGLALRTLFDVVPLWGFVALGAVELAAAGSAVLDWRDAKLEIGSRRRALLVGHVTLVHRLVRRARWHASTVRLLVPTRGQQPAAVPTPRAATAEWPVDERAVS